MKRFGGYLVTLALLPVIAACGGGADHGGSHAMPETSASPGDGYATADVEFAQMMIVHHQQAVQMSDLAATRASDPEIKQLAVTIKAAQQPEIDTMAGWLTDWKQPTAMPGGHNMPGMGDMPGMMSDQDMAMLLAASGIDFDRHFTRMMIAHHNGAIQMARDVQRSGSNPDVKRLAVLIEQAQAGEVQQLQAILDRL